MNFEDYKKFLTIAFPEAVRTAIQAPHRSWDVEEKLKATARKHYQEWGFRCMADCFDEAAPRSDTLTLEAWSQATYSHEHWKMQISCKAFCLGMGHVHFQFKNHGQAPLPFTETGYKSDFVPLGAFSDGCTIEDYIHSLFPKNEQLAFL